MGDEKSGFVSFTILGESQETLSSPRGADFVDELLEQRPRLAIRDRRMRSVAVHPRSGEGEAEGGRALTTSPLTLNG